MIVLFDMHGFNKEKNLLSFVYVSLKLPQGSYNMCRNTTKPTKWTVRRSSWAFAQSDQSLRCPHEEKLGPRQPNGRTVKTLINLGIRPGWSESSLGAHVILLVLSWCGSIINANSEGSGETAQMHSLVWSFAVRLLYEPDHAKMCLMTYANNKGADQPAHPRSLISTFVVRCLDSMMCIIANPKFQDSS